MKKILSLLLVLTLCVSLTVFAAATSVQALVYDNAQLLSSRECADLSSRLQQLSNTYGAMIAVCTLEDTPGGDADAYIEEFYDSNGLGYGADHSGVLLMVCMDVREFRILSNGTANDAIGDWEIEKISDAIVSDMSDGNYAAAFEEFADQCDYYLDGHINGFPFRWGQNLVVALIIGLIAGLITAFSLKAQLKSIRKQDQADMYVKSGSMQVTARSDLFLYRHVTRQKKETNKSSGSSRSGSSRSVGGRSF